MVYAPYGRTGVYMLQDALERLAPVGDAPGQRLDVARRVMRHLPATAWLRQNGNFGDHLTGGMRGCMTCCSTRVTGRMTSRPSTACWTARGWLPHA